MNTRMFLITLIGISLAFGLIVLVEFLLLALVNHRAHQLHKRKPSKLPYLDNPKLISGHYFRIIVPAYNYQIIDKLHHKLGNSFGFYVGSQSWVATKDLDLLKLLEVDEAHKHINRIEFNVPFKHFDQSIFQLEKDKWRKVRRLVGPLMTNNVMKSDEMTSELYRVLDRLMKSLESRPRTFEDDGSSSILINNHDINQRYTLSVLFLLAYGSDNIISFDGPTDEWVHNMNLGARDIAHPIVWLSMLVPFCRPFCKLLSTASRAGQLQNRILNYISDAVVRRRNLIKLGQPLPKQRRLIDSLIDAYFNKKVTYQELMGTALFLTLAGFETTANTITNLSWHLTMNARIQEKLRMIILKEGENSQYLDWCVKESIRIHPAVPLGVGRVASEDIKFGDYLIPKGTYVMPSNYSIHHDKDIWGKDCHEFIPERWENSSQFHVAQFMGFGLGPRNCVGGKLSVQEIKLFICRLLARYKLEATKDTVKKFEFTSPGLLYTIPDHEIIIKLVDLVECQTTETIDDSKNSDNNNNKQTNGFVA